MTSFIQTMFVPNSPSFPSLSQFSEPLAPVRSMEQTESCTHLDIRDLAALTPAKRKRNTTDDSMVEALREALLSSFTTSTTAVEEGSRSANPPSAWQAPSGHPPVPPKSLFHSSFRRIRRETVSDDEAYLGPGSTATRQCHCKPEELLTGCKCRNAKARGPSRPQRTAKGTSSWQLRQFAEATLGSDSLRKAVKLPEGEDANEWFAVNIVDFYNQINLIYGSITEFCSPQTCPEMKATDEFEYLWQDSENYKRPTKMSAPEYIEHLMSWCQANIDNEQLFPSRIGVPFPKTFPALLRQMFKRLYRVYAHIYCHHYRVIIQLGLEPHLNTSFKHYVLFVDEHQLASGKDFWGPLGELVESMLRSD